MRTSLSAKARSLDIFEVGKLAAAALPPDAIRSDRIETALEVEFRSVDNLLHAMDNLAGRGARARRRVRRR
jgi:hypothetical protein